MASKKKVGILFGGTSLHIVEVDHQTPKFFSSLAYTSLPDPSFNFLSDPVRITGLVQKTLREQKIEATDVCLSLSTKDIIFRSFTIPAMNSSEVKGVVEFEVRKYIPFKLSELNYTFHAMPASDKGTKSLRIIFCGIKNDLLESYCSILEQAGLTVATIEPASLSLVRCLTFKRILPKDKRVAIIQADDKEGKIVIVDHAIPQFMRDFTLFNPSPNPSGPTTGDLHNARLFNEVRVSFDYYARQNTQDKMDGLVGLASSADAAMSFSDNLNKEFNVPSTPINTQSIFNYNSPLNVDLLCAYGVCLRSSVSLPAQFDFPRSKTAKTVKPILKQEVTPVNVKTLINTAVVCGALIVGAFLLTSYRLDQVKKKVAVLTEQQGKFATFSVEDIEKQTKAASDKKDQYKNIRVNSHVAFFLSLIPSMLPEGAWLKEFSITYTDHFTESTDSKRAFKNFGVNLSLGGMIYAENTNQEIRLAKKFASTLKENTAFSRFFEDIDLVTAQTQTQGKYPVTYFRIECR